MTWPEAFFYSSLSFVGGCLCLIVLPAIAVVAFLGWIGSEEDALRRELQSDKDKTP